MRVKACYSTFITITSVTRQNVMRKLKSPFYRDKYTWGCIPLRRVNFIRKISRAFFFFSIPTNILVTRNLINWHFTWKIHRCARCWRITWILEYTSLETLKPYTYRYGLELSGLFSTIRTFYCFTFQNTKNNNKLVLLLWLLSCWWWTVSSGL